ncbi:hypothetical protein [Burkholderia sp. FERM BP-3421]|jgi:hypothetical protein|uniref:hypothetical protein n=1 Tax=Burkholderia sp. FERM BP-3421 TaxID=1494466 RepID=UPI003FCD7374
MKLSPVSASSRSITVLRMFFSIALMSGLSACGGSAPLFTSDGRSTTLVQCPAGGPWETCTQNAQGICGGDFDTIQQSVDNGVRNLLFACKPKKAD